MKLFWTIILTFLLFCSLFGQNTQILYKEKGSVELPNDDKFNYYRFIEDGKKIVLVGEKGVATWDLENLKMLNYFPYEVREYYPVGKTGMVLSLGIAALMKESDVEVDPDGKWFAAIEGKKEERKAVARNLQTGAKIAELSLPYPIKYIDLEGDYLIAYSKEKDSTKIGVWNSKTFAQQMIFSFDNYKWHKVLNKSGKILFGLGNSKFPLFSGIVARSGNLALFDLHTGNLEKQFTAPNMLENDFFYEFQVTKDEKYLFARRDKRVFIWEIEGNGSPKLEISPLNLKNKVEINQILEDKIIVTRADNSVRAFNFADSPVREYKLPPHKENIYWFRIYKDYKNRIVHLSSSKTEAVLLDLESGKSETANANPPAENEKIRDSAFIMDGKYWTVLKQKKEGDIKTYRTEIYNMETGKLDFAVPYELGSGTDFSADENLFYTESLGNFYVWNCRENNFYQIRLRFSTKNCPPTDDSTYNPPCSSETTNDEIIRVTSDRKHFIKYGGNQTIIYNLETGKEIQQLSNSKSVEYDKSRKIKHSGIWRLQFMPNGNLTNAVTYYPRDDDEFTAMNYCFGCRSFTFWEKGN